MIEFWLKNILLIQKSHGKSMDPLQMMMFSWLRFALWPSRASMISLHMHLDSQEHILKVLIKIGLKMVASSKFCLKKWNFTYGIPQLTTPTSWLSKTSGPPEMLRNIFVVLSFIMYKSLQKPYLNHHSMLLPQL